MNRFNQIYGKLRDQHQKNGWEINEQRLRQQAWMLNDRLMFEASNTTVAAAASAAAGAGGGSGNRRVTNKDSILIWFKSEDSPNWYWFTVGIQTETISDIYD